MDKMNDTNLHSLETDVRLLQAKQHSFDHRLSNIDTVVQMLDKEFRDYREEERMQHAEINGGLKIIKFMVPLATASVGVIVVLVQWLSGKGLI